VNANGTFTVIADQIDRRPMSGGVGTETVSNGTPTPFPLEDRRQARVAGLALVAASLSLAGCGHGGGDGAKLEEGLKEPLSRAYGTVDWISCAKHGGAKVMGRLTAYDCTVTFVGGRRRAFCAALAKGVPLFDDTACGTRPFGRS
jgi:hypothetical protein